MSGVFFSALQEKSVSTFLLAIFENMCVANESKKMEPQDEVDRTEVKRK